MNLIVWLLAIWLQVAAALVPGEPVAVPTPVPATATPVHAGMLDVRAVVCRPEYTWDCETALAVVWCESRNDPWATGRAGERGWWQIHPVHAPYFDWANAYDPYVNTSYAHRLYVSQGWGPWSCARGNY